AKNDVATAVVPRLQEAGLTLLSDTTVVRIEHDGGRATRILCTTRGSYSPRSFTANAFVVAAGALNTPRLLLASGLDRISPAGDAIGRYLMRHCNAVVLGIFWSKPAPRGEFHKQIGINDFYFGHGDVPNLRGKLGSIQQFGTPKGWILRDRWLGAGRL